MGAVKMFRSVAEFFFNFTILFLQKHFVRHKVFSEYIVFPSNFLTEIGFKQTC